MADDPEPLTRLLEKLDGVKPQGSGYRARCPAHDDRVASLSVARGLTAAVILKCHAGCETADVVKAIGMTLDDLAGGPFVETRYVYQDPNGHELWTIERWANPKTFRAVPSLPPPAERVPYNLPWVIYARHVGQPVYIVEGEKDVETLREHGHIASCNVGGAGPGKWLPHYSEWFADLDVIVLADNDEPGRRHARAVYHAIRDHARRTTLAAPAYGKDVSELLAAGYPLDHVEPVPEDAPLASVFASAVVTQRPRWAWPRYFPMGSMSILEGDPGDGKSTLTCDLVARWSTGAPMPDGAEHGGPWRTMMISIEDDPATTIVPRLKAAGANLENVILVTGGQSPEEPYNLGVDLDATEKQVRQYNVKIIVLDPLMAFLPDKTNGLVDAEVRRALGPLQHLARRLDIAVVVVRHLTKSATRALYAGSGSIGIVGAARAAFLVRPDPRDPDLRVLAPTKTNLVRRPPALGYRFEEDERNEVARVRWGGVVDLDADTLFEGQSEELRDRDRGGEWLVQILDNTFMTWVEIVSKGKANGFTDRTLRRAREGLAKFVVNPSIGGILSTGSYWYLVDQWPFDKPDQSLTVTDLAVANQLDTAVSKDLATATDVTESETVVEREAELDERESICDICGSTESMRFYSPYWVIRCRAHDPRRWTP